MGDESRAIWERRFDADASSQKRGDGGPRTKNLPAFPTDDPDAKFGKHELDHLKKRFIAYYTKLGMEAKIEKMGTVLEWYSSHYGKKEGERS